MKGSMEYYGREKVNVQNRSNGGRRATDKERGES
jgi:hypothetical protein